MAISSYLKRCGYQQNELKNVLYLIPKTATKKVHIDGDEAYVEYSGDTLSIIKIKGNNLSFQEDTSFDDRFRFDKTITLTVDGYITFKDFYSKYYAIVEDKSGIFWMVNADFPSYITYTYTLNDSENKTDLVFYAASNIPTIKLANFNPDNAEECETYMPYGIENLKLLEKNKSKLSTHGKYIIAYDDFYKIEAIDGTYELTEEFNGEAYTTQLSFSIPLSDYQASWHVKLLEFEKNKYRGYLTLKNSDYKTLLGYNTGLFPSYVINGDIVTITLTESSNYGMIFDDVYYVLETIYRWTRTTDTICVEAEERKHSGSTYCGGPHNVDKYVNIIREISYDSGETWYTSSSSTLIEANSYDCGYRTRTTSGTPYCDEWKKCVNVYNQISYDSGANWETTATTKIVIDPYSTECNEYSNRYLTFRALEDGTFSYRGSSDIISANTLEYSVDSGETWSTLQIGGTTPTVTSGNTILWKASGLTISPNSGIGSFKSSGRFDVEGNIMSLVNGDDFVGKTTIDLYQFSLLFTVCSKLVNSKNLVLPSTTLQPHCYAFMFHGCSSLVTTPQLPATTLAGSCYSNMFSSCSSLVTVPQDMLPATTLANGCYSGMFAHCSSLTAAPKLPATTLSSGCYSGMFWSCISLTTPANLNIIGNGSRSASGCCQQMYCDCRGLVNPPTINFTHIPTSGFMGTFMGCTSLTKSPVISATNWYKDTFTYMFSGCTSLSKITCLVKNHTCSTDNDIAWHWWVKGVTNQNGIFYKTSDSYWCYGDNHAPSGWTIQNYAS